jgi:hypothetical protein
MGKNLRTAPIFVSEIGPHAFLVVDDLGDLVLLSILAFDDGEAAQHPAKASDV